MYVFPFMPLWRPTQACLSWSRERPHLPANAAVVQGDHIMLPSIYAPVAGRCTVSGTRSIALYELFNCHLRFNCSRKLNHFDEYFQCHQYLIPYIVWKLCGRAAIFDKHPIYNILSGLIIFYYSITTVIFAEKRRMLLFNRYQTEYSVSKRGKLQIELSLSWDELWG